ncbi:MAG: RagB/SusD family nutrient uptake outer membrane protein [Candidatus Azobacteroides sp.]|nr:RagB/SusD family nutrient uptake outer membrane protein [Candidatus Azobacteroides sp.]
MKNYKNNRNISVFFLTILLAFTGCTDVLDLDPKDKIDGDRLFKDPEGVKQYMANLYYQLPIEDFNYCPYSNEFGFNVTNKANYNTNGIIMDTYTLDGVHSDWHIGVTANDFQWWTEGYELNRDVNLLIDEIPHLNVSDEERKLLIGESSFIRAYLYFGLAKRYGGVPLIKETQEYIPGKVDDLKVPRSTEKETWDFILEECDKAIANLPEDASAWGNYDRRATKWAALALKSRAALHAASLAKYWKNATLSGTAVSQGLVGIDESEADRYYSECIKASHEIMASGKFSLYRPEPADPKEAAENYQALFETPYVASEETIFLKGFVRPGQGTAHNYDIWYNPNQTTFSWPHPGRFNPTLDLVDMYEDYTKPGESAPIITLENGQIDNGGYHRLRSYRKFDSPEEIFRNKDARFFASINYPGGVWKGETLIIQGGLVKPTGEAIVDVDDSYEHNGLTYYTYGADNALKYSGFSNYGFGNMTRTGFLMRKFLSEKVNVTPTWNQSITDYIDMRYAEVLLNYAEAVVESGYTADNAQVKAAKAINDIRRRAGHTTEIPLTLENVLRERRVELAFENKHFWDLIRRREFHEAFDGGKQRLGLMPLLDLRGDKPQYIMVRTRIRYAYAVNFLPYQYYRSIPGIGSSGLIQNPQY